MLYTHTKLNNYKNILDFILIMNESTVCYTNSQEKGHYTVILSQFHSK